MNHMQMVKAIKIFILDNSGYGMVKQTIDTWLSKNYVGCDKNSGLSIPNFLNIFNYIIITKN